MHVTSCCYTVSNDDGELWFSYYCDEASPTSTDVRYTEMYNIARSIG